MKFSIIFFCSFLYGNNAIDDLIEDFMKRSGTVGLSVAIAKQGKVVFSKGYGYANLDTKEKVTPSHQFRIASLTKPMTASAIIRLIQERKLKLHDKVFGDNKHKGILNVKYKKIGKNTTLFDIEVLHLLEHTSGNWYNKKRAILSNAHYGGIKFIEYVLSQPNHRTAIYSPGKIYDYSNFGYYVLGLIIEKITGMTYENYMRNIFLKDFSTIDFYPKSRSENLKEVKYISKYRNKPYKNEIISKIFSAGGAVSSAEDLVKFGSMFDEENFNYLGLNKKSINLMRTPQTIGGKRAKYAKGLSVPFKRRWWHSGALPGTSSILLCDDKNSKSIARMCVSLIINTEIQTKYRGELIRSARKIGSLWVDKVKLSQ
jgi:CubicO group peptidase (beta-lactamase class C family)